MGMVGIVNIELIELIFLLQPYMVIMADPGDGETVDSARGQSAVNDGHILINSIANLDLCAGTGAGPSVEIPIKPVVGAVNETIVKGVVPDNKGIPKMATSLSVSRDRSSRRLATWTRGEDGSGLPSEETELRATALVEVLNAITTAGLPGPYFLIPGKRYLGEGAQSFVYEQLIIWEGGVDGKGDLVAIKQPKFDLGPHTRFSLASSDAQKHLQNICLEIKALSIPTLSNHPNIVRLFSWSYGDMDSFHFPLVLAMELANTDLDEYLSGNAGMIPSWQKYRFCTDIAAGLDAIHSCKLIHGDLKPANILLFSQHDRYVAKIGDFGLSLAQQQVGGFRLGGTPGWQAPEVARRDLLPGSQLLKADNYTFGLVAWRMLLDLWERPLIFNSDDVQLAVRRDFQEAKAKNKFYGDMYVLEPCIYSVLHPEPPLRPDILEDLFTLRKEVSEDDLEYVVYRYSIICTTPLPRIKPTNLLDNNRLPMTGTKRKNTSSPHPTSGRCLCFRNTLWERC